MHVAKNIFYYSAIRLTLKCYLIWLGQVGLKVVDRLCDQNVSLNNSNGTTQPGLKSYQIIQIIHLWTKWDFFLFKVSGNK